MEDHGSTVLTEFVGNHPISRVHTLISEHNLFGYIKTLREYMGGRYKSC